MSSTRREWVKSGGAVILAYMGVRVGARVLTHRDLSFERLQNGVADDNPDMRATEEVTLDPKSYWFYEIEWEGGRIEYTLDSEYGPVQSWFTVPQESEQGTSYSSNVNCANDVRSREKRTVSCEMPAGEYTLVLKADEDLEARVSITIDFYES